MNTPVYLGLKLSVQQDCFAFPVQLTDLAVKWYDLPVLLNLPSLSATIQVPIHGWHLRRKHARHLSFLLNALDQ